MPDSFKTQVLDAVKAHTGHRVKLPLKEGISWAYDEGPDHREVRLSVSTDILSGNLGSDAAASPVFALCLAAALDGTPGAPARAAVEVVGPPPPRPGLGYRPSKELLKYRRAAFLLDALAGLLSERFHLEAADEARWSWPEWDWFAVERYRKNKGRPAAGVPRLAYELELNPGVYAAFAEAMEPIGRFQPHFPVVVHSGEVSKSSNWTIGGKAGVDLWVASADHRRMHLFELDASKKQSVGSLALALCNLLMLGHVFTGGGHYDPKKSTGLEAVRRARRMVLWLTAQNYNPLIFDRDRGDSAVLSWLNDALAARNAQVGVLPWTGDVTAPGFDFGARWGGGFD